MTFSKGFLAQSGEDDLGAELSGAVVLVKNRNYSPFPTPLGGKNATRSDRSEII